MNALFGQNWQKKVQEHTYDNNLSNKRQHEHKVNNYQQFQQALMDRFEIISQLTNQMKDKYYSFDISNKKRLISVQLVIYNYKNIPQNILRQVPTFKYKISSIYKLPLSQKQFTSWIFRSYFNVIESQQLFISIDFTNQSSKILFQLSKFQSDVLNLVKGEKRLTTQYWKPIIINKKQIKQDPSINLFTFIQKTIQEIPPKNNLYQFIQKNSFSTKIFNLSLNPYNFIDINNRQSIQIANLQSYFLKKERATIKKNQSSQDLQISYQHKISQNQKDGLAVIIYFYNYKQSKKVFSTTDLLLNIQSFSIFKMPMSEKQLTNLFFKTNFLVVQSNQYYLSIQFDDEHQEIHIQISMNQQDVLKLFRGEERFSSNWTCIEEQSTKLKQNRIYSLEQIIRIIGENVGNGTNKIINKLYSILKQ